MMSVGQLSVGPRYASAENDVPAVGEHSSARLGPWLTMLGLLLVGYALGGRGFAYLGIPPLYVGELVLLAGAVSAFVNTRWHLLAYWPFTWMLAALAAWGLSRTYPYVGEYGVDALRDAAMFGYAAFALLVMMHLIDRPDRFPRLLQRYGQILPLLIIGMPLMWLITRRLGLGMPHWPGIGGPILSVKGGDVLVHFAGALAFIVAFGREQRWAKFMLPLLLIMSLVVGAIGSETRSGLLAFAASGALCLALFPRHKSLWQLAMIGLAAFLLLGITGLKFRASEEHREFSFDQIIGNISSMFGEHKDGDLNETKDWRFRWWDDIAGYTFGGNYRWTGKGFGINLADDDGYQVVDEAEDSLLRSPHNGHLTILARAGVPGFVLWLLPLVAWLGSMAFHAARARWRGESRWAGVFLFLLAYGTAFLVQATFDVYLEGPVAGIWFWSVFGVGMAAMWLYRREPMLFAESHSNGGAP